MKPKRPLSRKITAQGMKREELARRRALTQAEEHAQELRARQWTVVSVRGIREGLGKWGLARFNKLARQIGESTAAELFSKQEIESGKIDWNRINVEAVKKIAILRRPRKNIGYYTVPKEGGPSAKY